MCVCLKFYPNDRCLLLFPFPPRREGSLVCCVTANAGRNRRARACAWLAPRGRGERKYVSRSSSNRGELVRSNSFSRPKTASREVHTTARLDSCRRKTSRRPGFRWRRQRQRRWFICGLGLPAGTRCKWPWGFEFTPLYIDERTCIQPSAGGGSEKALGREAPRPRGERVETLPGSGGVARCAIALAQPAITFVQRPGSPLQYLGRYLYTQNLCGILSSPQKNTCYNNPGGGSGGPRSGG